MRNFSSQSFEERSDMNGYNKNTGEDDEGGREERRACVSFLRTTGEQKTRPSSVRRCDSWGMFGCTSNTLSVVAKIEQPSKAPRPTAEKRIKSFHERSAKKRCCCSAYAASFLYLALFCSGVTHGQSEF